MEIIIITGPPYSGKGTQCEVLQNILGFIPVSTGERIRKEKEKNSKAGKSFAAYEEKGTLVPDELMQDLVAEILEENSNAKGIILDGYPRTRAQVDALARLLQTKNLEVKLVIHIDVPKDELLKRAKKRAESSNRKDDKNEDTHLKRISIFEEETRPAIKYMKEQFTVVDIDGRGSIEKITSAIAASLKGISNKEQGTDE